LGNIAIADAVMALFFLVAFTLRTVECVTEHIKGKTRRAKERAKKKEKKEGNRRCCC
jgi:hypothetical protein